MVDIKVFDQKLKDAIKIATREVSDLKVPFTLMIQSWYKSNRAIFQLKGPGKYADLKESTKKRKLANKKIGFVYPILKAFGALEKSLTRAGDENSVAQIIGKKTLILGTRLQYSHFLHSGTKFMAARPVVLVGSEQVAPGDINKRQEAWTKILEDYVLQKVGKI